MGYSELFQYFHIKTVFTSKLAAQIDEEGPRKTKDLPDQAKDIQDNPCSHAIHSQLPLLTS